MKGCVYILKSLRNGRFYIGSTSDLERRLEEHKSGRSTYTSFSLPFKLVFSQEYETIMDAKKIEYWLKRQKDKDLLVRIIGEGVICKRIE